MAKARGESVAEPAQDAGIRPRTRARIAAKPCALGRSRADFEPLQPAELALVEAVRCGRMCEIAADRPAAALSSNTIRAGFLRFLALGGDAQTPLHELGIELSGAWIDGEIDLSSAEKVLRLRLENCHFSGAFIAQDARMQLLYLAGSRVAGIDIERAQVEGGLFLRSGFVSDGSVKLGGVRVSGVLDMTFGAFDGMGDYAIHAEGLSVAGAFYFRDVTRVNGVIDLTGASVGSLTDDMTSWPQGELILEGFTFGRIAAAPCDAASRINWLRKQAPVFLSERFAPQPWEHLITLLRDMGHPADAKEIAIEKQRALRAGGRIGRVERPLPITRELDKREQLRRLEHWIRWPVDAVGGWMIRVGHDLYGLIAGYGYQPDGIITLMVAIWIACALAYDRFGMRIAACSGADCKSVPEGLLTWRYSLDAILPIDFGLIDKGGPVAAIVATQSELVAGLTWAETLVGWLLSGLLVGIAGQLIKKD